jgi:hypothetical protein
MLVNDNLDVETLECRLSSKLFRGTVNSPIELGAVNHVTKLNYLVERKSNLLCALSTSIRTTRRRYALC